MKLLEMSTFGDETFMDADEHNELLTYVLSVLDKSENDVMILVGDKVSTNKSVCKQTIHSADWLFQPYVQCSGEGRHMQPWESSGKSSHTDSKSLKADSKGQNKQYERAVTCLPKHQKRELELWDASTIPKAGGGSTTCRIRGTWWDLFECCRKSFRRSNCSHEEEA